MPEASELVREARLAAGMTAQELAIAAGVATSTVSRVEKGQINPTVVMLERLLDAAGADLVIELRTREPASVPTLDLVRRHARTIRRISVRHGASNVRVIGSVARGEAQHGSDVDLLVDVKPGTGLFEVAEMEDELTEALPWRVDVVTAGAVRGAMAHITDDAVEL